MKKKHLIVLIISICISSSVAFANNLGQIEELLEKYGKKNVAEFILKSSGDSTVTVQIDSLLHIDTGRPFIDYITAHSLSHDFSRLGLSIQGAEKRLAKSVNAERHTESQTKEAYVKTVTSNNVFLISNYNIAKSDLKQTLISTYGNSYSTIELLLNAGMKDYRALCSVEDHKIGNRILADLKNTYYPNFSTILLLYKSNFNSYNNLLND